MEQENGSLNTSAGRLAQLSRAGISPGSTFLPSQTLGALQAGLTQSTKQVQEQYILSCFPELAGKNYEQMMDWMKRNEIYFSCVGVRKPDPLKILNRLEYVLVCEKRNIKLAFCINQELTPMNTGGFMASVSSEIIRWPEEIKIVKT